MSMSIRRLVPPVMTAIAVITMFSLGFWQVERLQWKMGLIRQIEAARLQPPLQGLPSEPESWENLAFGRVQLEGTFLHSHEFHLAARYNDGVLGYHILTPFRLSDTRLVLLNRGWVSVDQKEAATRRQGNLKGVQSVVVMVRTDRDRNWFTPRNQPEKNIWFAKDIAEMAQASGLPLLPLSLDVLYDAPPGGYPKPFDGTLSPRNDHLGYALTWFSIGIACLVIYLIYRRQERNKGQNSGKPLVT